MTGELVTRLRGVGVVVLCFFVIWGRFDCGVELFGCFPLFTVRYLGRGVVDRQTFVPRKRVHSPRVIIRVGVRPFAFVEVIN